jgi:hypothetical protein
LERFSDVETDPQSLRKAYLEEFGRFLESVRQGCRSREIDYQLVRIDQRLDSVLSNYLASRMSRIK